MGTEKDGEDAELFRFWAQEMCSNRRQVSNALEWCRTPSEVRSALSAIRALSKACPKNNT
jgi:hypothetical protein